MSTRQPEARSLATAASKSSASVSGSPPGRMMSLPPPAIETRPGDMADRGGHLLGHDLAQQLAADRQVRVPQPRVLGGDQPGQPVGPAAVPAARRGVVETLGEAVANRHKGRFPRGVRE